MIQKSYDDKPALYLIPTPIGNMDDMTIRSIEILKSVDFLLCEDTRETGQLLKKLDIKKKMYSCHDHNEDKIKQMVIDNLLAGKNIGLVTDRGTPIISDPGYKIVDEVTKKGLKVIGLPGATALIPALIMSGINPEPFLFYGFLSAKSEKRKSELNALKRYPFTIIFYEAPHRIEEMLRVLIDVFGDRKIALCREISKMYEEIIRGNISYVLENVSTIKGEIVLIVEGNMIDIDFSEIDLIDHVNMYIEDGLTEKESIKKVAVERDIQKSIVYREYHMSKGD